MKDRLSLSNFQETEIKLGIGIMMLHRNETCIKCIANNLEDSKMYPSLIANVLDDRLKLIFICYRCGSVKSI